MISEKTKKFHLYIVLLLFILTAALAFSAGWGLGKKSAINETITPEDAIIKKDGFSIKLPAGWREIAAAVGLSMMAINEEEVITNEIAKKANFRSYYAVSYDTAKNGTTAKDYAIYIKTETTRGAPDIVFKEEGDFDATEGKAYFISANNTQKGINQKIAMVIYEGKNEDMWVFTFSTLQENWGTNKEIFQSIADSFVIR